MSVVSTWFISFMSASTSCKGGKIILMFSWIDKEKNQTPIPEKSVAPV